MGTRFDAICDAKINPYTAHGIPGLRYFFFLIIFVLLHSWHFFFFFFLSITETFEGEQYLGRQAAQCPGSLLVVKQWISGSCFNLCQIHFLFNHLSSKWRRFREGKITAFLPFNVFLWSWNIDCHSLTLPVDSVLTSLRGRKRCRLISLHTSIGQLEFRTSINCCRGASSLSIQCAR